MTPFDGDLTRYAPEPVHDLPLEPWQRVLMDAADYIEAHGWCQSRLEDDAGQVCARGSIMRAVGGPASWEIQGARRVTFNQADRKLREHLGVLCIGGWNNQKGRTAAEVCAALRNCAKAG